IHTLRWASSHPYLHYSSALIYQFFLCRFNSANQSTGTLVGQYVVTGCQSSCQKPNSSESVLGAENSSNVVIQPQADGQKHGIAFYGRENCEVLIDFRNVPVCTGFGAWSSFQIITIDEADDQLSNLVSAPILTIPPNAAETASVGDFLTVLSAMLRSVSAAASTGGEIWSTGLTGTTGIAGPMATAMLDLPSFQPSTHSTSPATTGSSSKIPFVVEVVASSGQSLGYIYAESRQEHSDVESCSDRDNEADAPTSAIMAMGVDGSTVSDMGVDLKSLTVAGVTSTLFVSTREPRTADTMIHPICEAIQIWN
ncbi:MAG: hypothetical protein Q9188_006034, partial [Gyalolechia gomerana]